MSLAGFDHVFQDSTIQDIGSGVLYRTVPPPVLTLLKIVSYLDDPHRRAKDLIDLRGLMHLYERDSERLFSDEVFRADLPDIESAGAFLLGLDLRAIATQMDISQVHSFVERMKLQDPAPDPVSIDDDWSTREAARFRQQLLAFAKGFAESR
jgi:predicted nucleotidyltransferase